MEQRISLVTLGVADVPRARAFYDALGWTGQEVEETVFYQAGSIAVVLWSREKLDADAGLVSADAPDDPRDPGASGAAAGDHVGGVVLAHNVRSRAEVDEVVDAARAAGARVTREPAETFYGGYAACFADLDGHVWEIAHNPGFTLTADGALLLPDFGADDG